MKFLYDFFPVLLFFIAYKVYDIYVATAVLIAASIVQVSLFWLKHRRFEKMHVVTLVLVVIFGGMTIAFHDEDFLQWKVSILNWLFGLVFLGSQFIGEKTVVQRMMGQSITLPKNVWARLNMAWSGFFISVGFINLYIMYNFDLDTWVNFKLFGLMGLTLAFVIFQVIFLSRYLKEQQDSPENSREET